MSEVHPKRAATTVALFSPFGGGNLGDAAILTAMMAALRRHVGDIDFVGITLDAASMQRTHGVSGTVLFGRAVPFLSQFRPRTHRRDVRWAWTLVRDVFIEIRHWWHAICFMRRVDLLVVAGGGQLDEEWGGAFGTPYALFKWTLAARLVGARVAFVSVGVCHLDSDLGRWFCRAALRSSGYASVRDPWSQDFVAQVLGRQRPRLAPDAAFGLDYAPLRPDRGTDGRRVVGISPIAYGRDEYWPTRDHAAALDYFRELTAFTQARLQAGDAIVLFTTDGPDWQIVQQMMDAFRREGCDLARVTVVRPGTLGELLSLLAGLDVVVASRLHGVILSHLLHKPVVAISYDRKVSTHMQQMGHERHCIDFHAVSSDDLQSHFGRLLSEQEELVSDLRKTTQEWRTELERQYVDVKAMLDPYRRKNLLPSDAA